MSLKDILPIRVSEKEIANLLDNSSWSSGLAWSQLEVLAQYFELYAVELGVEIISEGAVEPFLGLIISGEMSVIKSDGRGGKKEISKLGKSKAFGEISLIDGHPSSAAVIVSSRGELLAMSQIAFERLCLENSFVGVMLLKKIARSMSERLRQTSGRLVDFL